MSTIGNLTDLEQLAFDRLTTKVAEHSKSIVVGYPYINVYANDVALILQKVTQFPEKLEEESTDQLFFVGFGG